jgi:hypothetical protein
MTGDFSDLAALIFAMSRNIRYIKSLPTATQNLNDYQIGLFDLKMKL